MERSDRWLPLALRIALLGLFLWMVRSLITPVALGGLVALLLHPAKQRLAPRLGRFARFAPAWVTVGAVLLIIVPFVFLTIEVIASINELLTRDWSRAIERVEEIVTGSLSGITRRFGVSADDIRAYLGNLLRQAAAFVAGYIGGVAAALPGIALKAFLFVVAIYYFLRDGRALSLWLVRLSPFRHGETLGLFQSIRDTVRGALLGMIVTAAVQGALTTLALLLFGVPGAFLLGVLATVLSVVPMIGTTPVTVGATIYLFATGHIGAGIGMAVATVLIGLSDNVVRPWVQSFRGRMHPLIALLSILGGLALFGAAGLFVGPVVAAIAIWATEV